MLIAGNWKMNTNVAAATKLAADVVNRVGDQERVGVGVCPPSVSLLAVGSVLRGSSVRLGAQNMHHADHGAFTGEVAASMLRSVGCTYVILGHSERRQYFFETDEAVGAKVRQALSHNLVPIVCVGERLEERRGGSERSIVRGQLYGALEGATISVPDRLVVAYEPVWAIGTGETATPDQAQDMHAFIRELLASRFGPATAAGIQILYGGSMKAANARALLGQNDVDGGLIGGASLSGESFAAIVAAANDSQGA